MLSRLQTTRFHSFPTCTDLEIEQNIKYIHCNSEMLSAKVWSLWDEVEREESK